MNSRECLKLLNLAPDSTGQDIKLAYRKAVKQWHPDRHQQASSLVKEKAEKQMQALNTAYSILADYYDKHGYLPGYAPPEAEETTFTNAHTADSQSSSVEAKTNRNSFSEPESNTYSKKTHYQKPISKKKSSGPIWFAAIMVGVIAFYSFDNFFSDTADNIAISTKQTGLKKPLDKSINAANTTTTTTEEKVAEDSEKNKSPFTVKERTSAFAPNSSLGIYEEPADSKYFTYGDTGGRVFEIQGVPTKTVGDIWYYGQSEVHFQDGRVKSWVKLDNKLKAKK